MRIPDSFSFDPTDTSSCAIFGIAGVVEAQVRQLFAPEVAPERFERVGERLKSR
ncbi:MAG TPA: hypothetical protein VMU99_05580 [Acidimicrobiales bacterium]|nr:hypothetical protein [Acidimicrobiales bacterium]